MAYIPLERMIRNNPSIYKLVLLAAERANQLNSGSKPLIESAGKKASSNALQEICEGKIKFKDEEEKEKKGKK